MDLKCATFEGFSIVPWASISQLTEQQGHHDFKCKLIGHTISDRTYPRSSNFEQKTDAAVLGGGLPSVCAELERSLEIL